MDTAAALEAARHLNEIGRWQDAIEQLRPALGEPSGYALCLLAWAHDGLRQYPDMLAAAERAIALAPDDGWAHQLRANALRELDRPAEALRTARRAVELDPHNQQAYITLTACHLAVANTSRWPTAVRLRREALRAAQQAIDLAPDDADTHVALANALDHIGDLPAANDRYREALRLDPHHTWARTRLADHQFIRLRVVRAGRLYAQLAGEDPADPDHAQDAVVSASIRPIGLLILGALLIVTVAVLYFTGLPATVRLAVGGGLLLGYAALTVIAVRGTPPEQRHIPQGDGVDAYPAFIGFVVAAGVGVAAITATPGGGWWWLLVGALLVPCALLLYFVVPAGVQVAGLWLSLFAQRTYHRLTWRG